MDVRGRGRYRPESSAPVRIHPPVATVSIHRPPRPSASPRSTAAWPRAACGIGQQTDEPKRTLVTSAPPGVTEAIASDSFTRPSRPGAAGGPGGVAERRRLPPVSSIGYLADDNLVFSPAVNETLRTVTTGRLQGFVIFC